METESEGERSKMRKILFTTVNGVLKPFKGRGLSNTRLGKFVYEKVFVPNKPSYVMVEGFKLYIHKGKDLLSDSILISKEYEPIETKIIKDLVKEGDVVVDAGANIGYYTVLLSRAVGPTGKVYAFEPNKESFNLLKRNVKENDCNNVVLINKAISNKEGEIKFYVNENDKASSSTLEETKHLGTEVIVNCTTIDKEVAESVDFMKMDIEGAELDGLIGATKLLKNCGKMVLEVPEERKDFEDIKQLLSENKYRIKRLDEGNILCTKKGGEE